VRAQLTDGTLAEGSLLSGATRIGGPAGSFGPPFVLLEFALDNVTHTMVGAALGQAGLRRLTGLGTATLMIAANVPDIDAIAGFWTDSLAFRRGWTHGPLGILVLPVIVAGGMMAFDRLQARWNRRPETRDVVRFWPLLLLAYIGALTHPFLDWLNTYGIRLLMPFSGEWFYGDAVFIIDPWIWLALGGALFLQHSARPAALVAWGTFAAAASLLVLTTPFVPAAEPREFPTR
jgi:inner membrane protein